MSGVGPADPDVRLVAHVRGDVQGVGFRWWTRARALELGLAGAARNLPDGRVEVTAQGSRAACEQLLAVLEAPDGDEAARRRPGVVTGVGASWLDPRAGLEGFVEA
ncbi:acylphosphatase [Pseudokineococcus basanitobsidens]|uniref:acylphosphatase n=1 Tax=Pseudokineococcus basanitobsidens TaxID=1926649 RepID=A0ABU8RK08_9ACTN